MSSTGELDVNVISKMKVAEIKKELKARGLSTTGSKTELVERLAAASQISQDAMSEDGNPGSEILDEDEVLGGEEEDEGGDFDDDDLVADAVLADEPKLQSLPVAPTLAVKRPASINAESQEGEGQPKKRVLIRPNSVSSGKENGSSTAQSKTEGTAEQSDTTGKKVIKLSGVSMKERLELRAQKFGVPLSDAAKREARAERFGTPSSGMIKIVTATKLIVQGPSEEVLKKRAERFGGNVSSAAHKLEETDKVKKRQERFGVSAASGASVEDRKKLRAERFKL